MLVADLLKGQEAAVQISGEILLLKIVEGQQRLRRFLQIGDAVGNDLQLLLGLIPFCFCFIQATQEQIIELQKRLDKTETERDEAKEELKVISDSISDLEKTSQALLALYNLQQEYLTGNLRTRLPPDPSARSATSIWTNFCPAPIRKALRLRPSGIRN